MRFIKKRITLMQRLKWLKHAIEWLPLTVIPIHDNDDKWRLESFPFTDRFMCFWAGVETAIYGYVYKVE